MKNMNLKNHKLLRDAALSIPEFKFQYESFKFDWEEVLSASENYNSCDSEVLCKDLYWKLANMSNSMVGIMKKIIEHVEKLYCYKNEDIKMVYRMALDFFPKDLEKLDLDCIYTTKEQKIVFNENAPIEDDSFVARIVKNASLNNKDFVVHTEPYWDSTESDFETAIEIVTTSIFIVPAYYCKWLDENTILVCKDESSNKSYYRSTYSMYGTYGVDYM